jgi:tripartite-type tricarboxylate transporter receptor subunit TctC
VPRWCRTVRHVVRAGSIKAYAVSSDMRMALAPDIPTFVRKNFWILSISKAVAKILL